jgi:hypothetical protein
MAEISLIAAAGLSSAIAVAWEQARPFAEHSIGFSSNSLVTIAAVLIQLLACALLRKPISSIWPWLVIFLLICGNEAVYFRSIGWSADEPQLRLRVTHFLLTLAVPTMLMLAARWWPRLLARSP